MKKIITILLTVPILFHNIGILDVKAEQIVENKVATRNVNSNLGVPYEEFERVHKNLNKNFLFGVDLLIGSGNKFKVAEAHSLLKDMLGSFLSYTDQALGTDYESLGSTAQANLLYGMAYNFKFLKKPDNISCKVKYPGFDVGDITYERFKTKKYMYALDIVNTKAYKYANPEKNTVFKNYKFGYEKIEVYGIVNGYAHTKYGFIKIDDLNPTKPVVVTSIGLNKTSTKIQEGKTEKLTATINPSNATNKNVTWSSNKPRIATVDSKGNVKALKSGVVLITAESYNGKKATCTVTVSSIPVTSIKLNKTSTTIAKGKTEKLTPTVYPTNTSAKGVLWSSSNKQVATVDERGNVKAIGVGTATITCTSTLFGNKATCKVTVTNPVTSVKLNKTSTTIVKGKTEKLTAKINPSDATNKNVSWTSSNKQVVTVDSNGNVKAVGKGTAIITVTTKDGNKKATCKVTVKNPYKTRTVKFIINLPNSFKQKHYVEILDGNNNVLYTSAVKTGSSSYNFTYQLDTSSSSYTRKIRIRTVSGNKKYDSNLFKIDSSTINKNVTATFAAGTSGTTTNSLKTGKITQK